MEKYSDYSRLLLSLSQQLSQENIKELIFFCNDVIPVSEAECIKMGTDLFFQLQYRDKLSPENYDFLKQGLLSIGRNDLACLLPDQFDLHFSRLAINDHLLFGRSNITVSPPTSISAHPQRMAKCSPGLACRMLLKKISDQLRAKDLKDLVYICSAECDYSTSCTTGIQLFALLEKNKLIDNYDFLCTCLQCIGRNDLCKLLVMQKPHFLPGNLESSQHLSVKIGMFKEQQNSFAANWKWLSAIIYGDWSQTSKLIVPLITKMCSAYNFEDVSPLSIAAQAKLQTLTDSVDVESANNLVEKTLHNIYDCLEFFITGLDHIATTSSKALDVTLLSSMFESCSSCCQEFDKTLESLKWNSLIRSQIHKEREQRITPIGTPARNACNTLFEVCNELFGGEGIKKLLENIDHKLFTLEYTHYIYCYQYVMIQWLLTLIRLATSSSILDKDKLSKVLLDIMKQHQERIISVHPLLSKIIGKEPLQNLITRAEFQQLLKNEDEAVNCNDFICSDYLPFYALLVQLLSLCSDDKDNNLSTQTFCRDLRHYHSQLYTTQSYIEGCMHFKLQVMNSHQTQIADFRTAAICSNELCASAIQELSMIH